GAREPAVQDADHAGSAAASLDDPFRGDFQRSFFRLRDELLRWIPGLDGRFGFHARTEIGYGGAAHALLAGAWDEPRRDPLPRRDRATDFFGQARDFHFHLNRPLAACIFFHWHDKLLSLGCVTGAVGGPAAPAGANALPERIHHGISQ